MPTRKFSTAQAAFAIAGGFALMAGLVGALVLIARHSDAEAKRREQALVEHGFKAWVGETNLRMADECDWDAAVQNLSIRYDPHWAHANVGQFFSSSVGMDRSYVLDAADRSIYAMSDGVDVAPAVYETVAVSAAPLIRKLRQAEQARPTPQGKPPYHRWVTAQPVQAETVRVIGGRAYILTATLVQPDFGVHRTPVRSAIVVGETALDGQFAKAFADRFLLQKLTIHANPADPQVKDDAQVVLRDDAGAPVARLDWTPQKPGARLLSRTLPGIVASMLFMAAIALMMFRRGQQAARALVASESRARHLAFHDHLTGLPNRALFNDRLQQALSQLHRNGEPVGVLAIDLDHFKDVNDTYGHTTGDHLIVEIGARLKAVARANDTVARLGGDEFAILQVNATAAGLAALSDRILKALSEPVNLSAARVFVGASVGVALVAEDGVEAHEAVRRADIAMYRAKDAGRRRYFFFEPEMDHSLKARKALEHDLRGALEQGGLSMAYQPQADSKGAVVGVEALIRWEHPERGSVSPAFFIPIAEECGLIDQIGDFSLRQALEDSRRWPGLRMAVNLSAVQLRSHGFIERVTAVIEDCGVDPRNIELELTEGVLLEDDARTHETLGRLRAMGFSLALDDFGTGYSSLAYLRQYPIDKIKIDRSFVKNIGVEAGAEAVVGAMVRLARALRLKVIAEGVETDEQRAALRRIGCADIQGFLLSKPVKADEVGSLVRAANSDQPRAAAKTRRASKAA